MRITVKIAQNNVKRHDNRKPRKWNIIDTLQLLWLEIIIMGESSVNGNNEAKTLWILRPLVIAKLKDNGYTVIHEYGFTEELEYSYSLIKW